MKNLPDISSYDINGFSNYAPASRNAPGVYIIMLVMVMVALCILPFCMIDITVRANGIIRPYSERTEVRSALSGIIEEIYYKEGCFVKQGDVILRLKDPVTPAKQIVNDYTIRQHLQFIRDLSVLQHAEFFSQKTYDSLQSPLYKSAYARFRHQLAEQSVLMEKAKKDVMRNASLSAEKIISHQEFMDLQAQQEKSAASYNYIIQEQVSRWQQELIKNKMELKESMEQSSQFKATSALTLVRASVSGIITGIGTRYKGSYLQANETVGIISPEDGFVAECYIAPKDIAMIHMSQKVTCRLDAFDKQSFGMLTGKVIYIDNDFTGLDNKPLFKVRCSFHKTMLTMKNGFHTPLKKGLTLQARFNICRRSLWELLFNRINNWIDPQLQQQIPV